MISGELEEYRKMVEETQKTSDDFIAHGTLFESRLEPELAQIKRRFEHITTSIKVTHLNFCSFSFKLEEITPKRGFTK